MTFDDAESDNMIHACSTRSMWPPSDGAVVGMDLSKCTRLLPQDNDTGGFFVALFRKNRDIGIKAISL